MEERERDLALAGITARLDVLEGQLRHIDTALERLEQRRAEECSSVTSLVDLTARQGQELQSVAYAIERRLQEMSSADLEPRDVRYQEQVRRIREVVRQALPPDATVLVISKGDDELLRLYGRRAWHFPGAADGSYLGYHPKSGTAAVLHLEALRASGAQFLLIPASALWWLDHYAGFRAHLDGRYREVVRNDDVCRIYSLAEVDDPAPSRHSVPDLIDELTDLLCREPVLLDCTAGGLDRGRLDHATVMRYHGPGELPYMTASIDVVAVDAAANGLVDEAKRVAEFAVVEMAAGQPLVHRRQVRDERRRVSVIVPVYDGINHTRACLSSLRTTLPNHLDVEVVVVDDCSGDGTQELLERLAGADPRLRVVRHAENRGYLHSANAGAERASGDFLVFLNNDTVLVPGWLTALLRVFRDHPDAGVVGGRLVYPDCRLQEAGGLVFSDGSAAKLGYGDPDCDDPLFTFLREVDYCSGALLATTRELFSLVGGFDDRYGFGYYEDVDYCFAARSNGRRVFYQPESTIVHIEGGTAGTDVTRGAKRHQVANRSLFVEKWRRELLTHPERPGTLDRAAWRSLVSRSYAMEGG